MAAKKKTASPRAKKEGGRSGTTKRNLAGIHATAIRAAQNLANRNAVSTEGFSDTLGLFYTSGRKVYFLRAVPGRESPHPFSDIYVPMAQQDNFAPLL